MTVIVGALTKQGVTLAADGQTSSGWQKAYGTVPKLWTDRGYAFGGCGTKRVIQVVRHHVTWPIYHGEEEDGAFESFLIERVIPAIRWGVKDRGVVENDLGVESISASFLVARDDYLAEISGDGCVHAEQCGRMAIGSGYAEALGALGGAGPWTERDVVRAARTAALTAHGVGGDISVVNTLTLEVRSA